MAREQSRIEPETKVFLSYSRRDLDVADRLAAALSERGCAPLIDREDIALGEDWRRRLQALIVQADAIIFLISPASADSEICRWETAEAERLGKRILPVLLEAPGSRPLPEVVARLNWIATAGRETGAIADELIAAASVHIDWVREHTRLGSIAERWAQRRRDRALLLSGEELAEAERWLTSQPPNAPQASAQAELIRASRENASRRQRLVVGISLTATVVAVALAAFAFVQREWARDSLQTAEASLREQAIANARLSESVTRIGDIDAGIRLAVQGLPQSTEKPERAVMPEAVAALSYALDQDRRLGVLEGHRNPVFYLRFNPAGDRLVTVANDDTARLWDARTRKLIATLENKGASAHAAFNPDGTRLVTIAGKRARVWEAATGTHLYDASDHDNFINRAEFTPDGASLLTAGADNTTRIWKATDGSPVRSLTNPAWEDASVDRESDWGVATGIVHAVSGAQSRIFGGMGELAITPDSRYVVTAGRHDPDATPRLWEIATGRPVRVYRGLRGGFTVQFVDLALSSDGTRVVGASLADHTARVWNVATGDAIAVLRGHTGAVETARFSPQGDRLVTASQDGTARLWDGAGRVIAVLSGHRSSVTFARFSPDGQLILTGSLDKTARLWNGRNGALVAVLQGHADAIVSGDFNADGSLVATGSRDATVRLWRTRIGQAEHTVQLVAFQPPARKAAPPEIALTATRDRVLVRSGDDIEVRTTRLVHLQSGAVIEELDGIGARFVDDGAKALTANLRLWSADTGRLVAELRGAKPQLDGRRRRLVAQERDGLRAYDLTTGAEVSRIAPDSEILAWHLAPSGDVVLIAHKGEVSVWGTATGRRLGSVPAPPGLVTTVLFDPKSERAAIATDRRGLLLIAVDPLRAIALDAVPSGEQPTLSFSTDGRLLRAVEGQMVHIWNAIDGRLLQTLKDDELALHPNWVPVHQADDVASKSTSSASTPDGFLHVAADGGVLRVSAQAVETTHIPAPAALQGLEDGRWIDRVWLARDGRRMVVRTLSTAERAGSWLTWDGVSDRLIPLKSSLPDVRFGRFGDGSSKGWQFTATGRLVETSETGVRLFDQTTGDEIVKIVDRLAAPPSPRRRFELNDEAATPQAVRLAPDGKRLLSQVDGVATLWTADGARVGTIGTRDRPVVDAWLEAGYAVTHASDGSLGFWRSDDGAAIASLPAQSAADQPTRRDNDSARALSLRFVAGHSRALDGAGRLLDMKTGATLVEGILAHDAASGRIARIATETVEKRRQDRRNRTGKRGTTLADTAARAAARLRGTAPDRAVELPVPTETRLAGQDEAPAEPLQISKAADGTVVADLEIKPAGPAWTAAEPVSLPIIDTAAGLAVTDTGKGFAQVVRLADGQPIADLDGEARPVTAALHAGAKLAAAGGPDGQVRVWRLGARAPILQFTIGGGVARLAFAPDGKRLVAVAQDGAARLWELEHGKALLDHASGEDGAVRASFNRDGSRLLLEGHTRAHLVDSGAGAVVARLDVPRIDRLSFDLDDRDKAAIAFSADGGWLYSPWTAGPPRLWSARTGAALVLPLPPGGPDGRLQFAEHGRLAVYSSQEGLMRIDLTDQPRVAPIAGVAKPTTVRLSPDGAHLAVATIAGGLSIWDIARERKVADLDPLDATKAMFASRPFWFDRQGTRLLAGGSTSVAVLYEASTGRELMRLDDHRGGLKHAEFIDGRWLLTRDEAETVHLWDLEERRLVVEHRWAGRLIRGLDLAVTEAGVRAAVTPYLDATELIDLATAKVLAPLSRKPDVGEIGTAGQSRSDERQQDRIAAVALMPGGQTVAIGTQLGTIEMWDIETKTLLARHRGQAPGAIATITAVGRDRFVSVTDKGITTLWSTAEKRSIAVLDHERAGVAAVIADPSGRRILLRHDVERNRRRDEEPEPLTLWDAVTGVLVARLEEHRALTVAAFSPDGAWLATGGSDGRVHIWNPAEGEPAKEGIARKRPMNDF